MTALSAPERGTTVNVGLISGGTGRNVIAARASCGIDIRIAEPEEMKRIHAAPHALAPSDRRVRLTVTALTVGLSGCGRLVRWIRHRQGRRRPAGRRRRTGASQQTRKSASPALAPWMNAMISVRV
ncbi:peptidase dimerization domain-containing protein [Streptomyces solisilvae]|uniref:peptidase dimerization domain-containing protein n=1 Tax=Streptomyces malaysiensis TaxID=92644 RepID=UPI0028150191|nr:peptidase dimerization domain-containing protein [Streptomyces samsunensis]